MGNLDGAAAGCGCRADVYCFGEFEEPGSQQ
jgi:hypothetical protein